MNLHTFMDLTQMLTYVICFQAIVGIFLFFVDK